MKYLKQIDNSKGPLMKRSMIFKTKGYEHVAGNKAGVSCLTEKATRESRFRRRVGGSCFRSPVLLPGHYAYDLEYLMEMNISGTMSSRKQYQTWTLDVNGKDSGGQAEMSGYKTLIAGKNCDRGCSEGIVSGKMLERSSVRHTSYGPS